MVKREEDEMCRLCGEEEEKQWVLVGEMPSPCAVMAPAWARSISKQACGESGRGYGAP